MFYFLLTTKLEVGKIFGFAKILDFTLKNLMFLHKFVLKFVFRKNLYVHVRIDFRNLYIWQCWFGPTTLTVRPFRPKMQIGPSSSTPLTYLPYLARHFFVSISEFVDACDIAHQVFLFDGLPLQGSSLILAYPALDRCTHRYAVDFVITFCTLYTLHVLV